jgi:hypothetical protein
MTGQKGWRREHGESVNGRPGPHSSPLLDESGALRATKAACARNQGQRDCSALGPAFIAFRACTRTLESSLG